MIGLALLLLAPAARAGNATPFPARQGLELASAAAQAWSRDAVLVYASAVVPPSTIRAEAVTNEDSSEARKRTQFATSRAVPSRPSGAAAA